MDKTKIQTKNKTLKELKIIAKQLDIKKYYNLSKDELINLINETIEKIKIKKDKDEEKQNNKSQKKQTNKDEEKQNKKSQKKQTNKDDKDEEKQNKKSQKKQTNKDEEKQNNKSQNKQTNKNNNNTQQKISKLDSLDKYDWLRIAEALNLYFPCNTYDKLSYFNNIPHINFKNARDLTNDELELYNKIEDIQDNELLIAFKLNNITYILYNCHCGRIGVYNSKININNFEFCSIKCGLPNTIDMKGYLFDNGCIPCFGYYKNKHTSLTFICHCGKMTSKKWENIIKNPQCKNHPILNMEELAKEFDNKGLILITKYPTINLEYICKKNNHKDTITLYSFRHNHGCNECAKEKQIYIDKYKKILEEHNCIFIKVETLPNKSNKRYVFFKCEKGHERSIQAQTLVKSWINCPLCEENDKLPYIIIKDWFGGKLAGAISEHDNGYQVTFKCKETNSQYYTKFFSYNKKSKKEIYKEAKQWQELISVKLNLNKNRLQIVQDKKTKEQYLRVELQKINNERLIMSCDLEDIEYVKNAIWTAHKSKDKKTYYVRRRKSKKREHEYIMFHRLISSNYSEVDHIDRNGLNNRKNNLREGKDINPKNKGIQKNNTSGIPGVRFEDGPKARWKVQISDNGKRKSASFSIKQYGLEGAKEKAINQRLLWE